MALVEFMTLRYSYYISKQHYIKESSFSLILCLPKVMECNAISLGRQIHTRGT